MWIPPPDKDRRIEEHTNNDSDVSGKQEAKELAAEERKATTRKRRAPAECSERVTKWQREENAQALSNTEMADKAVDWKSARASASTPPME